jgi:rfaE bifunctional protein nucleotidyltransferase chain/domain
MDTSNKITSLSMLVHWRKAVETLGDRLVVTNGCFDVLHAGHIDYLEKARSLGNTLLVGLNGDDSIRQLKGHGRPVNSENDRARILASLECVNVVVVFPEMRATEFLKIAKPHIYVKGGDYTLETLDQNERRAVEEGGGKIVILPFTKGKSTTALLEKIKKL